MVALVGKKLGGKTTEIALVIHGGTVLCMNILIYSGDSAHDLSVNLIAYACVAVLANNPCC